MRALLEAQVAKLYLVVFLSRGAKDHQMVPGYIGINYSTGGETSTVTYTR